MNSSGATKIGMVVDLVVFDTVLNSNTSSLERKHTSSLELISICQYQMASIATHECQHARV